MRFVTAHCFEPRESSPRCIKIPILDSGTLQSQMSAQRPSGHLRATRSRGLAAPYAPPSLARNGCDLHDEKKFPRGVASYAPPSLLRNGCDRSKDCNTSQPQKNTDGKLSRLLRCQFRHPFPREEGLPEQVAHDQQCRRAAKTRQQQAARRRSCLPLVCYRGLNACDEYYDNPKSSQSAIEIS